MYVRESVTIGGRQLTFETGRLAKHAHGAVLVTYGESIVLVTATSDRGATGPRLLPAHLRVLREDVRRGQDPRRLLQARGAPARLRDPDLPPHGPARSGRSSPRASRRTRRSSRRSCRPTSENPTDVLALTGAQRRAAHLRHPLGRPGRAASASRRVDGEFVVVPDLRAEREGRTSIWSWPSPRTPSSWSKAAPTRPPRPTSSTR